MLCAALVLVVVVAVGGQNINTCPGSIGTLGWCDCSPSDSGITLQQFFFSPNPVRLGQNVTISLSATDLYTTAITGGSVAVQVAYMGIPLINVTQPLCTVMAMAHQADPSIPKCPVPPTQIKPLRVSQLVPNAFPAGPYTGQVAAVDQTGRSIHCVQFSMTVSS